MASRVKLKVCGITNWTDARRACDAGADFLGFNFCRLSPRYVAPATARRIISRLPARVSSVGVFVNASEEDMLNTTRTVGLAYLQLHGDETAEVVSRLRRLLRSVKVIKAIRVRKSLSARQLNRFEQASAILLDGFDGRRRGGTGQRFDWRLVPRGKKRPRIFLAGGLTPENVAAAIRMAKPYAIDVCSGVESAPGKKDPAKMKAMMRAINGSIRRRRSSSRAAAKRK